MQIHTVVYEELTSDIETVASGVCQFLGVEPNRDYLEYHRFNREKSLVTPSRSQVVQPMYKSSCNRWLNYRAQVEHLIPLVQPFIDRYGYAE